MNYVAITKATNGYVVNYDSGKEPLIRIFEKLEDALEFIGTHFATI